MIGVIIVDDHTMVRNSLAMFLETAADIDLMGEAANGEEAIELCRLKSPDVVLMDLMMPRINGIDAIREILSQQPQIKIIALTSFVEDNIVRDALEAGAISYLLKNASLVDLIQAINQAIDGHSILAPEATRALITATRRPIIIPDQITPRERDVLALMVDGCTNREIALQLDLSLSTIKFHVSSILSKLNASGRTEAVSIALKNQLLDS